MRQGRNGGRLGNDRDTRPGEESSRWEEDVLFSNTAPRENENGMGVDS